MWLEIQMWAYKSVNLMVALKKIGLMLVIPAYISLKNYRGARSKLLAWLFKTI